MNKFIIISRTTRSGATWQGKIISVDLPNGQWNIHAVVNTRKQADMLMDRLEQENCGTTKKG